MSFVPQPIFMYPKIKIFNCHIEWNLMPQSQGIEETWICKQTLMQKIIHTWSKG